MALEPNSADAPAKGIPESGTVWVDERLASLLGLRVGESLSVGNLRLMVGSIITYEPDRGLNFFSVAPRLLMNLGDLDGTGLIQPGSRVSYRLLFSGEYKNKRIPFVC